MTHASIPEEKQKKAELDDGLIRLSVGVEDVEDLMPIWNTRWADDGTGFKTFKSFKPFKTF